MSAVTKFTRRYRAENAELSMAEWDGFIAKYSDVPDWVSALRKRGHEKVVQQGLPTKKLERFKYFNLSPYLKKNKLPYAKADIVIDGFTEYVRPLPEALGDLSEALQAKIVSAPVGEDKYGDMMLWDSANAYLNDGLVLDVPAGKSVDKPLNVTVTSHADQATVTRNVIRIGANSDVTIVEYHIGSNVSWHNSVTQIVLEKGARLKHYRIQENNKNAAYTQNTHVEIAQDGHYEAFTLTKGAALSRNQVHVDLQGAGAECFVNGVNMLSGKQQGDTTITVEHQAPNCISKQDYRSVMDAQAICTFQGKVHVHEIAQKTDGYQLSNTLLLSPTATMNTKPELEIYADDVKCSHGATSGNLDKEALFYMQSRGIPETEARALLIKAFLEEVIEQVSDSAVREQVELISEKWLVLRGEGAPAEEWL